jgi:ketosteroid isomerase-like protein
MKIDLPGVITEFIQAKNGYDSAALAACFTEQAIVHDEGQQIIGPEAIQKWIEASNKKYQDTVTPVRLAESESETILTAQVSGNFPGSPVSLDFCFILQSGKIAQLKIVPTEC